MAIDWGRIRDVQDLLDLPEGVLFDEAPVSPPRLTPLPGLTAEQIEDALFWRDYMRGIILITGMPGQGKGMLAHMIACKAKHYFGLNIVSDTRPRKIFGLYYPFSEEFLVDQMDRMTEVARGLPIELYKYDVSQPIDEGKVKVNRDDIIVIDAIKDNPLSADYIKEITGLSEKKVYASLLKLQDTETIEKTSFTPYVDGNGDWVSSRGKVFTRNAIWLLDEFGSKYMNIREPNNPIHRTILMKVFPIWRHLQSVIIGIGTERDDFDARCYPKATCEIHCTRLVKTKLIFGIKLYPLRYISATGELEYTGRKVKFKLDGEAPQDLLGGKTYTIPTKQ